MVDHSALQDLGINVVATGTNKSTEEDKKPIRELMGENVKMIDDGILSAVVRSSTEQGGPTFSSREAGTCTRH